jgi:hypothetical protein
MRIIGKLLAMSLLLAASACNPDSEALDSSENLLASPKNVVQALTLDVPWTCQQASRKVNKLPGQSSDLQVLAKLKVLECENRELNQEYPDQTQVTVVVHLADPSSDTSLYVRWVPLFFSDSTIGVAARKLLRMGGFPDSLDASTAVIQSATGTYSASAYLRSIRKTTPLVVFLPMKIQGSKLTPDIYQAACARVKLHQLY